MLFSYLNEKPQRLVEHMDAAAPVSETPAPANETPEEPVDEVVEQELLKNQWNDEDECIDEDRQKLGEK